MREHLVTSAIFVVPALVPIIFVSLKYDLGTRAIRKWSSIAVLVMLLVAGVSAVSHTTVTRCRRNPLEFCEYNDGVPMIATTVLVFVVACGIKAWYLYSER